MLRISEKLVYSLRDVIQKAHISPEMVEKYNEFKGNVVFLGKVVVKIPLLFQSLEKILEKRKAIVNSQYSMMQLPNQPEWYPKNLHITFDDGPSELASYILRVLRENDGVKATFFLDGKTIEYFFKKKPERTRKILQKMIDEGHQIAYHCYYHCHSKEVAEKYKFGCHGRLFDNFTTRHVKEDFKRFSEALDEALGYHYDVRLGRIPGSKRYTRQRIKDAYRELGLEVPKRWHFHDMPPKDGSWNDSHFWNLMKNKGRMSHFVAEKIIKNPKEFIVLLHEKPLRGKFLDILLKEVKKQQLPKVEN